MVYHAQTPEEAKQYVSAPANANHQGSSALMTMDS